MANVLDVPERGFRFIEGVFQYSAGVAALPGHGIERARFANPIPLHEGFARIEAHLAALGLPPTAFAACELRSPEPFTEEGFTTFNRGYFGVLEIVLPLAFRTFWFSKNIHSLAFCLLGPCK